MSSTPTLMLVDGNNLVYRSFFAIPPLSNREGIPTNAVYGFATTLRKFLSEESPELVSVVFDAGGKTFRHEVFKEYKANRPPTPDNLALQLPYTRRLCEALGVSILELRGVEADDLIGTLAKEACDKGHRVLIVSSDKDFFQLVSDQVTVVHPAKETRYTPSGVVDKFGVSPQQFIDVLALMGDSVDNVPGVPGIGEKGAAKLIAQWGSVEAAIEHADEIKNKRQREGLQEHREQALLSKRLVTISTNVVVDVNPSDLVYRGANREKAFELFEKLGFTTLLKDYLPDASKSAEIEVGSIASAKSLSSLVKSAKKTKQLSFRLETSDGSFDPWSDSLSGAGLSSTKSETFSVELSRSFNETALIEGLRDILEDSTVRKIAYDLKPILLFMARKGIALRGPQFDIKVASYCLNPSRRSRDLEELALEFTGRPILDGQSRTKESKDTAGGRAAKKGQQSLPGVDVPSAADAEALRRVALETERLHLLAEKMDARIQDEGLGELFEELEMPLIEVLAQMERVGIAIDRDVFRGMSEDIGKQLDLLTEEIYELAGCEFNINSPKQLAEVLFEKMNLPSFKKTTKTRLQSTRVEVLEELAQHFELPRKILDYRSFAKLKGTYVDALPTLVHADTGRIHTTFNQTVAATGRLTSSDPNLQNIPIRTELGRQLRKAFVAEPGNRLISADYSQIELRVLAHLSGDEALIEAFQKGEDIHARTAREVFGSDETLSDAERRRRAKIVNFSIIYGKTAFTLGKDFGVPTREAQAFIDHYFERYPRVRDLIEDIIRDARRTGKVRTLFGRHRYIPEIGSRNRNSRMGAERVAVNTPIQGTAADLIKKAMLGLSQAMESAKSKARLFLQVHDELVLEAPEDEVETASALVTEVMENVYPLDVPLKVDVAVGTSWEH